MRNIVVSVNITADGFIAGPYGELDWHFKFWDDELCACICETLYSADTLLLGKNTYNALAGYWHLKTNDYTMARTDAALAELMSRCHKIVCSNKPIPLPWINSSRLHGNLKRKIGSIKLRKGKDIVVFGSRTLIDSLIRDDLIDRYELWVHPIKIRSGIFLFDLNSPPAGMMPAGARELKSGVKKILYRRQQT